MLHKTLTLGVFTAALALAPSAMAQQCVKDMDCAGDAICEGGQCVGEDGEPVGAAAPAAPGPGAVAAPAAAGAITLQVVKVEFLPRGGPVLVTDTGTGRSCMTPCTLEIPAGSRKIKIGTGYREWPLVVPANGGRFTVSDGDTGLLVGGILFTAFGAGLLIPGLVFMLVDSSSDSEFDSSSSSSDSSDDDDLAGVGKILTLIGAPMFLVGLPMLIAADKGGFQSAHGPRRRYVAERRTVFPYAQARKGGGMLGVTLSF